MFKSLRLIFGALLLLLAHSLHTVEGSEVRPIPIIIDTDADTDDMLAILYLLRSPLVEVRAITTSGGGLAHYEHGAKNIARLLELADSPHLPVAYGSKQSLSPVGSFPSEWREEVDEVMGIHLPKSVIHPVEEKAWELIERELFNSPSKVTFFCIGPLTNIAMAIEKNPLLMDKIERIYFMGGALMVPGNILGRPQGIRNVVAEYNIFLDAKAASIVINSGVSMTLIPMDIKEHVPITKEFFNQITSERKTASANFLYEAIKPFAQKRTSKSYFLSPVAATILTHPEIATYRKLNLVVNLRKGPEYGRVMMSNQGPTVLTATGIEPSAFYRIFLETMNLKSKAPEIFASSTQ